MDRCLRPVPLELSLASLCPPRPSLEHQGLRTGAKAICLPDPLRYSKSFTYLISNCRRVIHADGSGLQSQKKISEKSVSLPPLTSRFHLILLSRGKRYCQCFLNLQTHTPCCALLTPKGSPFTQLVYSLLFSHKAEMVSHQLIEGPHASHWSYSIYAMTLDR